MAALGGVSISVVLAMAVGVLVQSLIIHLAARLSGIRHATFGMAIKTCVVSTLLSIILSGVFSFIPGPGTLLGFLISLFLNLLILKSIYRTGWGRALIVWLMQVVVMILLGLVMGSMAGMSLFLLLQPLPPA